MEAPQIVGIICDAVDPGTDVLVEVPALGRTWKCLLQTIERLFEIAIGTPEVSQSTL